MLAPRAESPPMTIVALPFPPPAELLEQLHRARRRGAGL
jgi:hypothetical protein